MEDPSTRKGKNRTQIDLGEDDSLVQVSLLHKGDASDVVLKSAAILWRSSRIPIPPGGILLGPRPGQIIEPGSEGSRAEIKETNDGHALIAMAGDFSVYLNGEPLVQGERRPLGRGDGIAVDENLVYYLAAGQSAPRLPSIASLPASRLRSSSQELVIGRDEHCDLTLDYPTVSKRHAVIRTRDGYSTIEDCGSATGLRVNGIPVRKTDLQTGDQISIGPYRIIFDGEELVERAAADGLPVEARAVSLKIGNTEILQPTDVHLRAGELVAFIGESGAGKTTLLKMLAGVSNPTGGAIFCGGEAVHSRMNEIGYVPQFDIVHDQLTVYEAVDFAARLRLPEDTSSQERQIRVTRVIDQLGLAERAHVRVNRLSGGQRKRVAVGIELLHRPGAIFLDEPTTGLDPGLEKMLMELFREIADTGKTVSLVTHATGSLALCDRVIVMGRGGFKRFDGSPEELLAAFNVDDYDDVYARLAEGFVPPIQNELAASVPLTPPAPHRSRPPNKQRFRFQANVLARRYMTLVSRDRRNLISIAIQTFIFGVITAILFKGDVFEFPPSVDRSLTGKAAQLIFLMVTISIWMGSIASAREVVKERSVMAREQAVGVSIGAYITSKLVVLLALVSAQVVVYFMIVLIIQPTDNGGMPLLLVLIGVSWIAVMLGLVVSAWARSEDQATSLIPILLVPQLLFGGALVTLTDMPGFVRMLTLVIPSRWAYDAGGTAVDMAGRLTQRPGEHISQIALRESYGPSFFHVEIGQFIAIVAVFLVLLYLLLANLIRRSIAVE
jgi:ABC-type multidrug transport system ATPase subunit/ABC-type multidrug transport system permease subunit